MSTAPAPYWRRTSVALCLRALRRGVFPELPVESPIAPLGPSHRRPLLLPSQLESRVRLIVRGFILRPAIERAIERYTAANTWSGAFPAAAAAAMCLPTLRARGTRGASATPSIRRPRLAGAVSTTSHSHLQIILECIAPHRSLFADPYDRPPNFTNFTSVTDTRIT